MSINVENESDSENENENDNKQVIESKKKTDEVNECRKEDLKIGVKVYVLKEGNYIAAEILQDRIRNEEKIYYVHYKDFNKRLDEWINIERISLSKGIIIESDKNNKKEDQKEEKKKVYTGSDKSVTQIFQKKKVDNLSNENYEFQLKEDEVDLDNLDVKGLKRSNEEYSHKEEIKKLRTTGSITRNPSEVVKLKNFNSVVFGQYIIEPWYFSPYPIEFTKGDLLYICEFTLFYFGSRKLFERFRSKCFLRNPPGNEIYRDSKVSFWEIDGKIQKTWCRNLCLLSKLFLDHKTLYYDVDPFLFYILTIKSNDGHHLVGYFSKEKESCDGYNVACILTLPCYQKQGYGKLLIQFSYMLSICEHKIGSPEKPLSDLGLLSYRAFWNDTLIKILVERSKASKSKKKSSFISSDKSNLTNQSISKQNSISNEITIEEISQITSMTTTDILHTLSTLQILRYYKGHHIIMITNKVMSLYDKLMTNIKKKKKHELNIKYLQWIPPTFTSNQLRFGW